MTTFQFLFMMNVLILRYPVHFKSFFLLSDDIVGMKYFRKKYFLFPQYHLIRGNKIWNVQGVSTLKYLAKKNWKIAIFQNLTYQLQTQFSQLPNGQNAKFQCLSDSEFPEFFKNGLTFDPSPFLLGVMVKKPWHNFFGTPCIFSYFIQEIPAAFNFLTLQL